MTESMKSIAPNEIHAKLMETVRSIPRSTIRGYMIAIETEDGVVGYEFQCPSHRLMTYIRVHSQQVERDLVGFILEDPARE